MMPNAKLIELLHPVVAFVPIDTTGAGQDGDWVHLKNHRRALIVIQQGAWAGGTPAVTLQQASDAAGTGAKALVLEEYWQGTALTDDTYARTAVASNTFNLPAVANTVTMFEIHVNDLDFDNGFQFFRVRVASPGGNADLITALYILGDPAHTVRQQDQPTAIA